MWPKWCRTCFISVSKMTETIYCAALDIKQSTPWFTLTGSALFPVNSFTLWDYSHLPWPNRPWVSSPCKQLCGKVLFSFPFLQSHHPWPLTIKKHHMSQKTRFKKTKTKNNSLVIVKVVRCGDMKADGCCKVPVSGLDMQSGNFQLLLLWLKNLRNCRDSWADASRRRAELRSDRNTINSCKINK